jgi:hypothetical protein
MNWIKVPHGKSKVPGGAIMGVVLAFAIMLALAFVPSLLAYGYDLPQPKPYVRMTHGVLDDMVPCDTASGQSDTYPCYWDEDAHGGRHGLGTPRYVLFYYPGLPYEWWGGGEG